MTLTQNQKRIAGALAGGTALICGICAVCGVVGSLLPDREATPEIARLNESEPEPESVGVPTSALEPSLDAGPTSLPVPTDTATLTETETVEPTATATPVPSDTPTLVPTDTPTVPPIPIVVIVEVRKGDEYVDIENIGGAAQDLAGWHLLSERGDQDCPLSGVIGPGERLRIWAMAEDAGQGGFNCGYNTTIWNNEENDPAILYDAAGAEIDRR